MSDKAKMSPRASETNAEKIVDACAATASCNDELASLIVARDVLQRQIDERVAVRDAQAIAVDPHFKVRKTRQLAAFVGGLGFRILDYKSKENPLPETGAAKLMFRIKDLAAPLFKDLTKKDVCEVNVALNGFDATAKSSLIQLCDMFEHFGWITSDRSRTRLIVKRGKKNQAIQFWNGGWAELVNRSIIETALQAFAKKQRFSYDIFYDVKLVRLTSEKVSPDMQLDVVARVGERFYVFETKTGVLAIDKWVERAKLFRNDQKSRFITCCLDEKIPTQWFRPFCLVPLGRLEAEMSKWLEADCPLVGTNA